MKYFFSLVLIVNVLSVFLLQAAQPEASHTTRAAQPESSHTTRNELLLKLSKDAYKYWRTNRGKDSASDKEAQDHAREEVCASVYWGGLEAWVAFIRFQDKARQRQAPFFLHYVLGGTERSIKYSWPYSFARAADFTLNEIDCNPIVDSALRELPASNYVLRQELALKKVCIRIAEENKSKPADMIIVLSNFSQLIMAGIQQPAFIQSCINTLTDMGVASTANTGKSTILITEISEPLLDRLSDEIENNDVQDGVEPFLIKAESPPKQLASTKKIPEEDLRKKILTKGLKANS